MLVSGSPYGLQGVNILVLNAVRTGSLLLSTRIEVII